MKKFKNSEDILYEKRKHRRERVFQKRYKSTRKSKGKRHIYTSRVLGLLTDKDFSYARRIKPYVKISLPRVFSIINNPMGVLKIFDYASHISKLPIKIKEISISHRELIEIDLAAESILDLIIVEIDKEIKSKQRKFHIKGQYPKDEYLIRLIRAIGIIKNLDIKHEQLNHDEEKNLKIFHMKSKDTLQHDTVGTSDHKERVTAKFVDHINSCLEANGRVLTEDAVSLLADYTGELLSNAEDHSGSKEWSIVGYLDNEHEGHLCEIAIFNFGETIANTFKKLDANSYTMGLVQPYIDLHVKKKLFTDNWQENDLLSLISLQGDISTKNESCTDDRGQGTVEMIEFFQQMHKECLKHDKSCARMAILSGSTHILFDGAYSMSKDQAGRNVIAFNEGNSLNDAPDKKYVTSLNGVYFPGTIISIRFPLQDAQIQKAD